MKNKPKMFTKDGFQGIWHPESNKLDVYEVDHSGAPYLMRTKDFTNSRVAEIYFMDRVGKRPSDGLV